MDDGNILDIHNEEWIRSMEPCPSILPAHIEEGEEETSTNTSEEQVGATLMLEQKWSPSRIASTHISQGTWLEDW